MTREATTLRNVECAILCLLAAFAASAVPAAPRITPVPAAEWTEEQRRIAEAYPAAGPNLLATLLHHPALARHISPFERYIVGESTLPDRDRRLLILRTAWLCRSGYVWAQHADGGTLTDAELDAIALGPDAPAWTEFEAALLRAVDELHVDAFVSDATWAVLETRYAPQQLLDLLFTVGELTMLAGVANALEVEIEPDLGRRLPYGIPYATAARWTNDRLTDVAPRLAPIPPAEWSDEVRRLLDPRDTGRRIANVYTTYAHHPAMDRLRRGVSEHIRDSTTLSDREREILLIRIGVLCRSEYEWSAHARIGRSIGMTEADLGRLIEGPANGESEPVEYALLRATDELFRDDTISDETWALLDDAFDTRQLLDVLVAIGGYRMFSMAMNSLGIQLDPGAERFPAELR